MIRAIGQVWPLFNILHTSMVSAGRLLGGYITGVVTTSEKLVVVHCSLILLKALVCSNLFPQSEDAINIHIPSFTWVEESTVSLNKARELRGQCLTSSVV